MKLSSLFRKTLLCQTLLFGVVVGSLSLTSAYSLRWYLAGEYASRGSAIASSVSGAASDFLADDSSTALQVLLDEFADLQGVAYVLVATAEGQLIAHTFGEEIPEEFQANQFIPGNPQAADGSDRRFRRFTHSPNFEKDYGKTTIAYRQIKAVGYVIDIALPIQGGTQGYVHVGMDQIRMIQQIRSAASLQLWVTLGLLIVSIIATYVMVQRISQPLNQLTEYAKRLANRDFSTSVHIPSQDEVGLLATTMQSMATDIQAFIHQLETTLSELQHTQSQLIQSEKMAGLGQLVAGVAHEINNPISFIACNINYAEVYAMQLMGLVAYQHPELSTYQTLELKEALDEMDVDFVMADFPKVLGSMRLGTERIREIVASLRNFSRLDEAEYKTVDIHEGIDSALMILNDRLKSIRTPTSVEVVKEYSNLPAVTCYAGQLNQVFLCLLTNALDALSARTFTLPDSPQIRIKTGLNGDSVEILIQDNGCGIDPAIAPRVFDPFFTTKAIGKGTGLGLSISYQIVVQHHQGNLTYQSVPEQGTIFTIQIPLSQQEPILQPVKVLVSQPASLKQ
ncbi:MAG: HAMP domain-containing protein [Leptolyngbya sp. SIO1D8]|nr:HAMP domain-containing protein [Leptolyngbya sp. SIO1D8]